MKELEKGYYLIDNFDEIKPAYQELFDQGGIKTLYKIRNWRERFHPEFLSKGEIYFGRPSEMNDPFDIHRPITFDVSVIEKPEFLEKMIASAPEVMGVNPGRDAKIIAEKRLDEIRHNPQKYFLDNYMAMIEDPAYNDRFGIFSLTTNPSNDQLWGYYGGGLKGFAVGFNAMGLTEELFSQGDFVNYTDVIHDSTIINQSHKSQSDILFQKNKRWEFESEFRFIRILEDQNRRVHYYSPKIVKEIILGPRISNDDKDAILEVVSKRYAHASVFQLKCDYSNGTIYPVPL